VLHGCGCQKKKRGYGERVLLRKRELRREPVLRRELVLRREPVVLLREREARAASARPASAVCVPGDTRTPRRRESSVMVCAPA
jgi:hypothetical protein